jgi:hypothetical protein
MIHIGQSGENYIIHNSLKVIFAVHIHREISMESEKELYAAWESYAAAQRKWHGYMTGIIIDWENR